MAYRTDAPRRERKKRETRERIRQAAEELFLQPGYDQASMEEIAERADVSRATLFNYFSSKAELLNEVAVAELDWLNERLEQMKPTLTPLERIAWYLRQLGKDTLPYGALVRQVLIHSLADPRTSSTPIASLQTTLGQLVSQAQTRGQLEEDIQPTLVARLLIGTYLASLLDWTSQDTLPDAPARHLDVLLGVLQRGIANE